MLKFALLLNDSLTRPAEKLSSYKITWIQRNFSKRSVQILAENKNIHRIFHWISPWIPRNFGFWTGDLWIFGITHGCRGVSRIITMEFEFCFNFSQPVRISFCANASGVHFSAEIQKRFKCSIHVFWQLLLIR